MNKFYSIISPPFDPTSGGIRVMYGLYGWLLSRGQIAYMNATSSDPDSFIAVYPEIYKGNEAGASTVVRYLLNKPGVMALYGEPGPTSFSPKDKIYTFSKMYYDTDDRHSLFLPILDLHTFKDQKKIRNKTCYLVGKGINQNKHPEDSFEITRQFCQDQEALANLFNKCHTFYCYDKITAQLEISRLCGCRVKYFGGYTKDELKNYEPGLNGISFGPDEEVPLDSEGFRNHYALLRKNFSDKLNYFIDDTQNA